MHFHRRDVLKRHQAVHVADPRKLRRRPRRGPLPRIAGEPVTADQGMHPSRGVFSSENGESAGSPTPVSSSTPRAVDYLHSGISALNLGFDPLLVNSAFEAEASRVEIPAIHDLDDWLAPYPVNLEQDVSRDLGLGMGDDLAQLFTDSWLQDVGDVNVSSPGDLCCLSTGQEPSIRNQIRDQVCVFPQFRSFD